MDIGGTPPPQGANSASLTVPSFYTTFPLPYRVLFLVGIGILLWALNLHILHLLGFDTGFILGVRSRADGDGGSDDLAEDGAISLAGGSTTKASFARSRELIGPVYGLLGAYTAWSFAGWLIFRWLVGGDDQDQVDAWRLLPLLTSLGAVIGLIAPYDGLWRRERQAFIRSLRRCVSSPVGQPILFCDVITADILTSFAKVIGDAWVSACLIFGGKLAFSQLEGAGSGLGEWVVPFMVSIPYFIRLRQCLVEWVSSDYKNGRPLANALKYASAFPVILFSAVQKVVVQDLAQKGATDVSNETWHGEHPLFRLWLLSVFVNSTYSFWWDVTNDWGLKILDSHEWSRVDIAPPTGWSASGTLLRSPSFAPHRRSKSIVARALGRLPSFAASGSHSQHSRGHSRSMSLTHARSEPPSPDRSLPAVSGQATAANGYFPPTPTGSDHPHYAASRANYSQAPSLAGTTLLYPPPPSSSAQTSSSQTTYPRGLRADLRFTETTVYYLAIVIDLVLRFTWSLKLSSKLHTISEIESGVFMMEVLELLRRWMWVFLRMEWEEIRKTEAEASIRRHGTSRPHVGQTLFEQDDDESNLLSSNGADGALGPRFTDAIDPLTDSRGPSPREKVANSIH